MTTAQFTREYTIPHLEQVEGYTGRKANGLFMLKAGETWYTTIRGWAFCLPSKFKRLVSRFTPSCDLPVVTDERFIRWAEDWSYEKNKGPFAFKYEGDTAAARDFLANLTGKRAVAVASDLFESILGSYLHGQLGDRSSTTSNGKHSRDAYEVVNKGWQFDGFPGLYENKRKTMQIFRETDELVYEEPENVEGGVDFINMLCDVASKMVVCPFVFAKVIMERRDGEIYFINTPDAIYFSVRRSI
jgi:hypothetical protein